MNPQNRHYRRLSTVSKVSLVLALGLALAACKKEPAAPDGSAASATSAAAPAVTAETAVSSKVSAMSVEDLRAAARAAYAENRLYAPSENNAVEYYLALRDKSPGDAGVSSALTDLLPMTVIATEQSVSRDDFAEAQRLAALLEKAEPQHPALARLKSSITTKQQQVVAQTEQQAVTAVDLAKRQQDLERERLAQQQQQQQQAAQQLATQQAAERQAAQTAQARQATEQRAVEERAAEARAAEQRAAQQPQQAPATPPAATASASDLRPLSTPPPSYPTEALRAGRSGEVQVEFVVGTDGTVTSARVVRSQPARVFDREALNTVRSWRFQPVAAPVTTRRTFGFSPGE
ncbi:MAG: energy transducer TonB [Pseudomonadota bacterium]|nr:energy transducer TonB [Pseudomonadota bacterium]